MHLEIAVWAATPALPQPRDTVVRLASLAPSPGAGAGEVSLGVTLPGDAVLHVGDLLCLLPQAGVGPFLVRVVGDVVVDDAGRWTATGKLD
jgi:hypothetical protein